MSSFNLKNITQKITTIAITLTIGSQIAFASSEGIVLDKAPDRSKDLAGLQRGAKTFVNYCMGCHSAVNMRYSTLKNIGLSEEEISKYLIFSGGKVADTMTIAMDAKDAKTWFGATPPDLSVIARAKASEAGSGSDYLYTYLRKYYKDEQTESTWNNIAYPNVAMPHPLWELQGEYVKEEQYTKIGDADWKCESHADVEKHPHLCIEKTVLKQIKPGKLTPAEYDSLIADLVGFLDYMAEPHRHERQKWGMWVLLFLGIFTLAAWRLNVAYWKDIK